MTEPATLAQALAGATFPRLMLTHAAQRPTAPAMREKTLGIWQTLSWQALRDEVELLAAGLAAEGFQRGQHLALVGENRPRLYVGMIAAQALGGIPVPMYQDAVAREMVYVFRDAEIGAAIVENQEQADKLLEVRSAYPALSRIYFDDPRGLRNYLASGLKCYDDLIATGRAHLAANPGLLAAEIARGSPD